MICKVNYTVWTRRKLRFCVFLLIELSLPKNLTFLQSYSLQDALRDYSISTSQVGQRSSSRVGISLFVRGSLFRNGKIYILFCTSEFCMKTAVFAIFGDFCDFWQFLRFFAIFEILSIFTIFLANLPFFQLLRFSPSSPHVWLLPLFVGDYLKAIKLAALLTLGLIIINRKNISQPDIGNHY